MVRSAVADENFLVYLTSLAEPDCYNVGLILGQPTPGKDYIIHFAKTPPCHGEGEKTESSSKVIKKLTDISDARIADHARHATRMLPGGMYVLGIFVVSQEDILSPFSAKVRSMLGQIYRRLNINEYLYGNGENTEKLVLNYCVNTQSYSCKSYDVESSVIKPANIKFQPNLAVRWLQVECKYELDQIFPIAEERTNWPLKRHMQDILKSITEDFKSCVFMFDGEIRDGDDSLESIGKKKHQSSKAATREGEPSSPMQVTILIPCDGRNLKQSLELKNCGGQIQLSGHVSCKLWLHPKASVSEASQAVVQDIVRSLAARLEMHCDSLIEEENGSPEDTNSIHEPPRRVLVTLPLSKVTLSDYLFPGEGPQEAQISLQELLDIKITDQDAVKDIEGQADLTDMYNDGLEADSEEIFEKLPRTSNKHIYLAGLGFALLVLIISLIIHFFKPYISA